MAIKDKSAETIAEHLERSGVSRRDFMTFCGKLMVAAPFGLAITNKLSVEAVAAEIGAAKRPSVIWLHMQECTGCTETLLRSSEPDIATLIFDIISLDYHETVMAPSGADAEKSLHDAMNANDGKFVCVVEGAIPTKDNGIYCKVGGKTALESLKRCAEKAAAVICIGSCASWGGVAAAGPNPTGATGAPMILKGKTVVTLPGCPANPYNLLGTVLQFATFGTLPKLDDKGRPHFAYGRVIHEDCPRRPHFDAGRFAQAYGDEGHRNGWCLYKLGCKGPQTHANCSLLHFCEVPGAWPIGIGHPCVGCTEQGVVFNVPNNQNLPIENPTAPMAYPGINPDHGVLGGAKGALAIGLGSAVIGAVAGAGYAATKKLTAEDEAKKE